MVEVEVVELGWENCKAFALTASDTRGFGLEVVEVVVVGGRRSEIGDITAAARSRLGRRGEKRPGEVEAAARRSRAAARVVDVFEGRGDVVVVVSEPMFARTGRSGTWGGD